GAKGLSGGGTRGMPRAGLVELVAAPSNLGLRPPSPGREPGVWRAPQALLSHGLGGRLNPARITELPRPRYEFDAQPGTRIRNGIAIRARLDARRGGPWRIGRVAVRRGGRRRLQHPARLSRWCASGGAVRPRTHRRPQRFTRGEMALTAARLNSAAQARVSVSMAPLVEL